MHLENHPTVTWYQEQSKAEQNRGPSKVEAEWVKQVVLDAGADDVGHGKRKDSHQRLARPAQGLCQMLPLLKEETDHPFPAGEEAVL